MARLLSGIIALGAVAVFCVAAAAADSGADAHRAKARNHYFNLEYDQALIEYYAALEAAGENARDWNYIATTLLYSELHRLGKLETSAFKGDNEFLDQDKPEVDPEANKRFLGAMHQARRLAEARLTEAPDDPAALFSLSSGYALEANYLFMIEKSYVAALRAGMKAKKLAEEAYEADPEMVDALLAPGVQEYVVGSLPWMVKALVAIGGVNGSKQKGQEMVEQVAREGEELRTEAQVLMTLLHRREGRPMEAAEILRDLIREFPRNYVLRLELGSMLADADERADALRVFEQTEQMVEENRHGMARMPERLRKALDRRIEELREDLKDEALADRGAALRSPAAAAA